MATGSGSSKTSDPVVCQLSTIHEALTALLQSLAHTPEGTSLNGDHFGGFLGRLKGSALLVDRLIQVIPLTPWKRFVQGAPPPERDRELFEHLYDRAVNHKAEWESIIAPTIRWDKSARERGAQWKATIGTLMDRVVIELRELVIFCPAPKKGPGQGGA